MKNFAKYAGTVVFGLFLFLACSAEDCDGNPSSDQIQSTQQEQILQEGTKQTGMPAIVNFRERKLLKDIIELRDQDGLTTYTYTYSEMTGKRILLCESIGYPIPYATQYTNPSKIEYQNANNRQGYTYQVLPQADPNGLYSPSSAEGTWVMCADPKGKPHPVYVEPRVICSPFKLDPQ